MDRNTAHVGKMETQLRLWGVKLDELKNKAGDARDEAAVDTRKRVHELEARYGEAKIKLDALKSASADKWDTIKEGTDNAWSELEAAFKKLKD